MQLWTLLVITAGFVAYQCNGRQQLSYEARALTERLNSAWRRNSSECARCDGAVSLVLEAYYNGTRPDDILQATIQLCKDQRIQRTDAVCEDLLSLNYEPLLYIAEHTGKLTSNHICSLVYQRFGCGVVDPEFDWSVDLGDDPKPESLHRAPNLLPSAHPLTILQLTDIHYDPMYLVGGNAECREDFCCRAEQGPPARPEAAAGRWSDYRSCDIPWEVVTETLSHIRAHHLQRACPLHELAETLGAPEHTHSYCSPGPPINYVYMTGDLIDHAVWETSREKNNETIFKVLGELKSSFGDIPVFPVLGNHDVHPFNLYAPVTVTQDNVSSAYLYETIADLWSLWLPHETRATILRGGFYTVLVRRGFRVVVLNNNHCYMDNYWLIYNEKDPDGQLQWLVGVLREAEMEGEKVHLLYHVPSGSNECNKRWSRQFNRIVNRFSETITGQFCGHMHWEEFHVFYSDEEPPRPVNVAYVGGSLTPFIDVNSNYKLYTVDPHSLDILDHETWIYNLTAANLGPADHLPWERMYSFKEAYGVPSITPEDIHNLAYRMVEDEALAQQYFRFYNLQGDPKLARGCNQVCIDGLLCDIVKSDSGDMSHCVAMLGANRTHVLKDVLSNQN